MATIDVELRNRWAYIQSHYPEEILQFFKFRPANYFWSPAYRKFQPDGTRVWDGYISLLKNKRVSAGLFRAVRKQIMEKCDVDFVITNRSKHPQFHEVINHEGGRTARDYQLQCISRMQRASNCGGIILAATGVGKTFIAGEYFKRLDGYGVFIVDELTLLKQTRKELESILGEPVGIAGDTQFEPQRITVATIQTLHYHRHNKMYNKWRRKLDVIILDELHLALNKRSKTSVEQILKCKAIFGLTATLEMGKKEVRLKAYALCGPVIFEYPYIQALAEKVLTPGVVIGVNIVRGNSYDQTYADRYSSMIVTSKRWNKPIRALVREAVLRDHAVIVIVDRVAHVESLTKRLQDEGVRAESVFGEKKTNQRIATKAKFEAGKIDVIITNRVFQKGIDIKRVSVIIDGSAGKSKNNARQKYGRGVRKHADKAGLIYFDIGDVSPPMIKNKFEKATKSRRRALKAQGLTVKTFEWNYDIKSRRCAAKAFDYAEKSLKKVLVKLGRAV